MNQLDSVAQELATEIQQGKWKNFNYMEQHPAACLAILSEFQSRAYGYEHKQYVRAISQAIEGQR